jgi:two-component system response regulator HydG
MNLPTPLSNPPSYPIIGKSEQIQSVWRKVAKVAPTDATVLITGETGVGKEVIAETIHENSQRKSKVFKAVNCGVFYQDLLQSELFGHEKGAFTGATAQRRGVFELADGGTLFLDEIGEMSPEVQVKFLRVLENQEFTRLGGEKNVKVDVRIIAATNVNLGHSVQTEKFREDLYYRLSVVPLHLPPLRKRLSDLPLLVTHFCQNMKGYTRAFSPEVIQKMSRYAWPGNVRELQHEVARLMVMAEGKIIRVSDLRPRIRGAKAEVDVFDLPFKEARQLANSRFMREYLHRALQRTQGNVTEAAKQCGIGRQYFQLRMSEYGLKSASYKQK